MREVLVPTGFLALLRQCRRPLIAVVIGIVVLQTFVGSLATAQAAALLASDPFGAGAICDGAGDSGAPAAPESGNMACCAFCTAAAPAVLPVAPPAAGRHERALDSSRSAAAHDIVLIAPRAVRAGASQAPPTFA